MNWEAIGAIGEVAGAIGVIVTLMYFVIGRERCRKSFGLRELLLNRRTKSAWLEGVSWKFDV